jgi:hypothetical protein
MKINLKIWLLTTLLAFSAHAVDGEVVDENQQKYERALKIWNDRKELTYWGDAATMTEEAREGLSRQSHYSLRFYAENQKNPLDLRISACFVLRTGDQDNLKDSQNITKATDILYHTLAENNDYTIAKTTTVRLMQSENKDDQTQGLVSILTIATTPDHADKLDATNVTWTHCPEDLRVFAAQQLFKAYAEADMPWYQIAIDNPISG